MTAICLLAVVLAFVALSLEPETDSREEPDARDLEPVQLQAGAAVPASGPLRGELLPPSADLERVHRAA